MTQRYLVTGAQGFIGRHMVSHLLRHSLECAVLGVGRSPAQDSHFNHTLSCGDHPVLAPLPEYLRTPGSRYRYVSIDIASADFAVVVHEFRPTKVIHLAAQLRGTVDELIYQNNTRSTACLLNALARCDAEFLLFASSGGVYGKQEHFPIDENVAVLPLDVYSRSKLASEDLVREFALQIGVPTAIARIFNVVGAGQDELHFAGRTASQIASILAHRAAPFVRVGPLSSSRDFIDVRDTCHALTLISESNHQGVYNVGSGVETLVGDLLGIFLDVSGLRKEVQIESDSTRTELVPRHVAKIGRLTNKGFAPERSLERICNEMLAYYAQYVYGV
jgi:nucleoside-diphosphate-sugar epimerase